MDYLSGKELHKDMKKEELEDFLRNINLKLYKEKHTKDLSQDCLTECKNLFNQLLKFAGNAEQEILVLLCCCFTDILRIVAPRDILSKAQVKSVFSAIAKCLNLLEDQENTLHSQIIHVLHVTEYSSLAMLPIKFRLFDVLSSFVEKCLECLPVKCSASTEDLIENNIRIIIVELPEVQENFGLPFLVSLKKEFKKSPRFRVCESILSKNITQMRKCVCEILEILFSSKGGKAMPGISSQDRYYIAIRLYKINSEYLFDVLNSLLEMMSNKKQEKMIVKMFGTLASCKKSSFDSSNSHIFSECLRLFESDSEEIRLILLDFSRKFCKNHRWKKETCKNILSLVVARVKDSNERVRSAAIYALKEISDYLVLPKSAIKELSDRTKDVKKPVRKAALESLIFLYNSHWIDSDQSDQKGYFGEIIEKVFRFLESFGDVNDQNMVIDCLQQMVFNKGVPELQAWAFYQIFKDLSLNGRNVLKNLLAGKSFWARALERLVSSECSDEDVQVFSANIKNSIFLHKIKTKARTNSGDVYEVLKERKNRDLIKEIIESNFNDKRELIQQLEDVCKDYLPGVKQIKSKCFNLLVGKEHISHLIDYIEVVPIVAKTLPEFVEPYLSQIVQKLKDGKSRKEVLDILSQFDLRKCSWEDFIQKEITIISKAGDYEEAQSSCKILKNLDIDFISNLTQEMAEDKPNSEQKSMSQLLYFKQIVKSWPSIAENHSQAMKNLAYFVIECVELSTQSKCLAIVLLHSLVKYCGFFRQAIFTYIRKIGFNLEKFCLKKINKSLNLNKEEEKMLRVRCFKSLITLICINEMKAFLNPKTLSCFAYASLNPEYSSEISRLIRENMFQKSNFPPPFLSVFALLLTTQESKIIRDALTQILGKMKQNSLEKQDPAVIIRTQPESYTPYIIYAISKCRLSDKSYKLILESYVKCLSSLDGLDVKYLMFLLKHMKKYSIENKDVKCDLWTPPDKPLGIDKVCDEMTSIISKCFVVDGEVDENLKALIPNSFYEKRSLNSTPNTRKSGAGLSERKREVESSTKKKEFNIHL